MCSVPSSLPDVVVFLFLPDSRTPPEQVQERDQAANCSSDEDLAAALAAQESGTSSSEQDHGEAGRVGPHGYISDGFLVADGSGEVSQIHGYPGIRTHRALGWTSNRIRDNLVRSFCSFSP